MSKYHSEVFVDELKQIEARLGEMREETKDLQGEIEISIGGLREVLAAEQKELGAVQKVSKKILTLQRVLKFFLR